eukprot:c21729_g1_i2 orf=197-1600(+)
MVESLGAASLALIPDLPAAAAAGQRRCGSLRHCSGRRLGLLRWTLCQRNQRLCDDVNVREAFAAGGLWRRGRGWRECGARVANCSLVGGDLVTEVVKDFHLDGLQRIVEDLASMPDGSVVTSLVRSGLAAVAHIPESERWRVLGGAALGWLYLIVRPGVLWGAVDTYILAPLQTVLDGLLGRRRWKRTDFLVGQRVGEGSFGIVYTGVLLPRSLKLDDEFGRRSRRIEEYKDYKQFQRVILKKVKVGVQGAEECGEVEEWFNYRVSRAAPYACAEFLGSFIADTTRGPFTKGGKWLVWNFEGDSTLFDFMKDRNFPENLGKALFGSGLQEYSQLQQKSLIIKKIMRQIISSLKKVHDTGIVHRDVKVSNLVVTNKGKVKFIDFGAATDLRIGKNYVPNQGMLDPDYCPPELYVLPVKTPKVPPAPLAAILSPFIWQELSSCKWLVPLYGHHRVCKYSSQNLRQPAMI